MRRAKRRRRSKRRQLQRALRDFRGLADEIKDTGAGWREELCCLALLTLVPKHRRALPRVCRVLEAEDDIWRALLWGMA